MGGPCPEDIFFKIDTVSLGLLWEGIYAIALVGDNFTYQNTLNIPTSADDSLYQFNIKGVGLQTGKAVPDVSFGVYLGPPADTMLAGITDSSGFVMLTYFYSEVDSLYYEIFRGNPPFEYLGWTGAQLGIPEIMTLGIIE